MQGRRKRRRRRKDGAGKRWYERRKKEKDMKSRETDGGELRGKRLQFIMRRTLISVC